MNNKTIKIYMASHQPCRFGVQLLINHLPNIFANWANIDYTIVSTWHDYKHVYGAPLPVFKDGVGKDIAEIECADLLIGMYPFGNGSRAELAIGVGRNMPMIALIPPEHVISSGSTSGWSDNFALARFNHWHMKYASHGARCEVKFKQLIVTDWKELYGALGHIIFNFIIRN